jgi:hypothetical protein
MDLAFWRICQSLTSCRSRSTILIITPSWAYVQVQLIIIYIMLSGRSKTPS